MNTKLSEKYDYLGIAGRLRIAADNLESLGTIGKTECDNFIKKNNLEYIAEEIEIAFRKENLHRRRQNRTNTRRMLASIQTILSW